MKSRWGLPIVGVLVVAAMTRVLYADARDDLGRVKSDYDAVKTHYDADHDEGGICSRVLL